MNIIMNIKRYLLCAIMLSVTMTITAAYKAKNIYMYGFAASFNDSTVYFTEVQQLDSAYIDSKTKFLFSRQNYSYQLRDYLAENGFPNATCVTFFALTRKEAEKKYLAFRKRYLEGNNYTIKYLKESEFKYIPIKAAEENISAHNK
jgi:hypothetical protein